MTALVVIAVVAVVAARVALMSGNAAAGNDPADKWSCGAARPTVSPSPVAPGQVITVRSGDAHCARGLPDGASFPVTLGSEAAEGARVSTQASVHHDGSFAVNLTVPDDFPLGPAWVTVDDAEYVPCHDTGQGAAADMRLASCAAAMTQFLVGG